MFNVICAVDLIDRLTRDVQLEGTRTSLNTCTCYTWAYPLVYNAGRIVPQLQPEMKSRTLRLQPPQTSFDTKYCNRWRPSGRVFATLSGTLNKAVRLAIAALKTGDRRAVLMVCVMFAFKFLSWVAFLAIWFNFCRQAHIHTSSWSKIKKLAEFK